MNKRIDEWVSMSKWMDGWIDEQASELMNGFGG
jgi:hypothetical protein